MYPILLVEDNPDDSRLIQDALRQSGNINEVVWRMDGETATEWLQKHVPMLVILDLKLSGGMSGLDVLRFIRGESRIARVGVVIFTESPERQKQIEAYRLGTNVYVRKTSDFGGLIEAVKTLQLKWAILPDV